MSFYINNNNPNRPGPLNSNPTNGLCEKALIEVTKVFDSCVSLTTETGINLTATDFTPANPALPLTFISAETNPAEEVTITNIVIDRIESRPNYANVSATITVPVLITYRDANGVQGTATSTVTLTKNVILFVPQPSATPIDIRAQAIVTSQIGTFTSPNIFTLTLCIQVILKVVATVDLLVPSYGYPQIPACQESPAAQCPGTAELPLYPTAICGN